MELEHGSADELAEELEAGVTFFEWEDKWFIQQ
jgi:hypothetical protein